MTEAEWLACADPGPMLALLRGRASERKLRLFAVACCRHVSHLLRHGRSRRALEWAEHSAEGWASEEEQLRARDAALQAHMVRIHEDLRDFPTLPRDQFPGRMAATMATCGVQLACEKPGMILPMGVEFPDMQSVATSAAGCCAQAAAFELTARWDAQDPVRLSWRTAWNSLTSAASFMTGSEGPLWRRAWDSTRRAVRGLHCHPYSRDAEAPEKRVQASLLRDLFGNHFHPVSLDPAWLTCNDRAVHKLAWAIYCDHGFDRLPVLADALEDAGCTDSEILSHCRSGGEHVRGCWVIDLLLGKE